MLIPIKKEKQKLQNFMLSISEAKELNALKQKTGYSKTQLIRFGIGLLKKHFIRKHLQK